MVGKRGATEIAESGVNHILRRAIGTRDHSLATRHGHKQSLILLQNLKIVNRKAIVQREGTIGDEWPLAFGGWCDSRSRSVS